MTLTQDFSQGCAYQRGEYVPISQAGIPLTDWGFLRSDATYDVVTAWEGAAARRSPASCRNACAAPGCGMRTWR